jgi:hypothetical protein
LGRFTRSCVGLMSKVAFNFFRNAQIIKANGSTVANSPIATAPCILVDSTGGSAFMALNFSALVPPGFIQFISNRSGSTITIHSQAGETINTFSSAAGVTLLNEESCILVNLASKAVWFGAKSGNLL